MIVAAVATSSLPMERTRRPDVTPRFAMDG